MNIPIFRRSIVLLALLTVFHAGAQPPLPEGAAEVRVTSSLRPELDVQPGEARTLQVILQNTGATAASVDVAQGDFLLDRAGGMIDRPLGSLPTSNASWLEVATQVQVPAGGTTTLPVTVRTPADAEPGTYWSLLMVEPTDPATFDQEEAEQGVRTTVTVNVRFGVTVVTHVGPPAPAELLFLDPELSEEAPGEARTLAVTIENPTRFLTSTEVWLELYDDLGDLVRRVDGGELRVYPGAARRSTFDLGLLGDGAYQVVIIADAGDDAVFGVRYDLDLTRD